MNPRNSDLENTSKVELQMLCSGMAQHELEFCKENGGYYNACTLLKKMKTLVLTADDDLLRMTRSSSLAAMLFFTAFDYLHATSDITFFKHRSEIRSRHLTEIAKVHPVAIKAFLDRPKLVETLSSLHALADIAGERLAYAELMLNEYPKVVTAMINKHTYNDFGFETNLGFFLVLIGEHSTQHARFIDRFNESYAMTAKFHARSGIDLVY